MSRLEALTQGPDARVAARLDQLSAAVHDAQGEAPAALEVGKLLV